MDGNFSTLFLFGSPILLFVVLTCVGVLIMVFMYLLVFVVFSQSYDSFGLVLWWLRKLS